MLNLEHFPDTVYAIQHLAFEDLGAWEDVFYQLGVRVRYFEAGIDNLLKAYEYKGLTIILGVQLVFMKRRTTLSYNKK